MHGARLNENGRFSHATALRCVAVVTILTGAGPVLRAQNTVQNVLVGETEITMFQSYKGDVALLKPVRVEVFDFKVPKEVSPWITRRSPTS